MFPLLACTVASILAGTAVELWLDRRQFRAVRAGLDRVPPEFADRITAAEHREAGEQAMVRLRFGAVRALWSTAVILGFLFWGFGAAAALAGRFAAPGDGRGLLLVGIVWLAALLLALPFRAWSTLVLEERFGFNRQRPLGFVRDVLVSAAVSALLGAPVLWAILRLQRSPLLWGAVPWWVAAWTLLSGLTLCAPAIHLRLVAPLFNRFRPLRAEVAGPVARLLERTGFRAAGLFEMDASRRSARGNAFFSGFGSNKRIVLFDTLLDAHPLDEVEAVVAHELGHSHHRHVLFGLARGIGLLLLFCAAVGCLATWTGLLPAFGLRAHPEPALRLLLAGLLVQCVLSPVGVLANAVSRRNEFQADEFARAQVGAGPMVSALLRLSRDNRATLIRDELFSLVHDTHPPVLARIRRLRTETTTHA